MAQQNPGPDRGSCNPKPVSLNRSAESLGKVDPPPPPVPPEVASKPSDLHLPLAVLTVWLSAPSSKGAYATNPRGPHYR